MRECKFEILDGIDSKIKSFFAFDAISNYDVILHFSSERFSVNKIAFNKPIIKSAAETMTVEKLILFEKLKRSKIC